MGNSECRDVYRLGRDVGMIPDPRMDSMFTGYLSLNSSTQLSSHYMDVHRSLSPEQFDTFNHSLRVALGESGKVTQGGVGVVALALSFLFDILAQQAKNQTESTHFIHRIFGDHENGNSSEIRAIVFSYLKLVPLIANDPQRMKEETERYAQRLNQSLFSHFERTSKSQNSSWTEWKIFIHGLAFHQHMMIHQVRMGADIPMEQLIEKDWQKYADEIYKNGPASLVEITNVAERLSSISSIENQLILSRCKDKDSVLLDDFETDVIMSGLYFFMAIQRNCPQLISQKEDFFY